MDTWTSSSSDLRTDMTVHLETTAFASLGRSKTTVINQSTLTIFLYSTGARARGSRGSEAHNSSQVVTEGLVLVDTYFRAVPS